MTIILPKRSSFGEEFGSAFGGGFAKGVSSGLESRQERATEELKGRNQQKKLEFEAFIQGQKDRAKHEHETRLKGLEEKQKGKVRQEKEKELLDVKKSLLKETGQYNTEEEVDKAAREHDLNSVRHIWKESRKPAAKEPKPIKSELDKTIEKETAKGYIEAQRELPKIEDSLRNLDRLEELGGGALKGLSGYIPALFGTESATEYNSLASSVLEPIIKIFNPVGAVPTAKLKWINETFRPSAGELRSTQIGKEKALKTLANQAKARAQQKIKLFDDYRGEPPASEVFKFDAESSKFLNNFIDQHQYIDTLKKEVPPGMVLMFDPRGQPLHVPPEQVDQLKQHGATIYE